MAPAFIQRLPKEVLHLIFSFLSLDGLYALVIELFNKSLSCVQFHVSSEWLPMKRTSGTTILSYSATFYDTQTAIGSLQRQYNTKWNLLKSFSWMTLLPTFWALERLHGGFPVSNICQLSSGSIISPKRSENLNKHSQSGQHHDRNVVKVSLLKFVTMAAPINLGC
jgi:hypothetical protein